MAQSTELLLLQAAKPPLERRGSESSGRKSPAFREEIGMLAQL